MKYQESEIYPTPRVEKKDFYSAYLLMQDYAGEVSEETAIHLYLYQFLEQKNGYQELADALHHIAIVEMHHFQLLGETIKLLGVDPVFKTKNVDQNKEIPWNSDYVNYEKEVKNILEIDIQAETMAIRNYELHKDLIHDRYIRELIDRIIEDEKIHLHIFYKFYDKIGALK